MHRIDLCAHSNRWAHWHPLQKLIPAGGGLLLSLCLPPLAAGPPILAAMSFLVLRGAGVSSRLYWRLLGFGMFFTLVGVVPLLVSVSWSGSVPVVGFTRPGLEMAARVTVRAWAGMSCLLFLALTTPLTALMGELRRGGIPPAVLEVMQLVYRMLWLLNDVGGRVRTAQAARLGYAGWRQSYRSTGLLAGALYLRVMERANRMEAGLAARGYDGSLNVLNEVLPLNRRRVVLTLLAQIALAVFALLAVRFFPWLN